MSKLSFSKTLDQIKELDPIHKEKFKKAHLLLLDNKGYSRMEVLDQVELVVKVCRIATQTAMHDLSKVFPHKGGLDFEYSVA